MLEALSDRFGLVACISGRQAEDARRIVGLDSLTYIGNHGLERLAPGADEPEVDPAHEPLAARVRAFAAEHFDDRVRAAGRAARGQGRDLGLPLARRARRATPPAPLLEQVAAAAQAGRPRPALGRMVLEIRPDGARRQGHRR